MKPIDIRNANWADIKANLAGIRRQVYEQLLAHGPLTTRKLALASGIDILTVRPRVTELHDIGFVELVGKEDGEGLYQAISEFQAMRKFEAAQAALKNPQLSLF